MLCFSLTDPLSLAYIHTYILVHFEITCLCGGEMVMKFEIFYHTHPPSLYPIFNNISNELKVKEEVSPLVVRSFVIDLAPKP